jgi:1-acyl-sn-glycerol-3-phosphate acyltransferase
MRAPIDGFDPARVQALRAFDPVAADRVYREVDRCARWLGVTVEGIENIPPGRALLVANHAFGWDVVFAMAAIWKAQRRPVWALGEHLWWQVPWLRRLAAAMGTVDGTPENADRLLSADQLVLVLPGGMREAVKPYQLRYQLLWGKRYGFVKTAIRNRAPIVPLASVGADELFDFVGNAQARGSRWLKGLGMPLPYPSWLVPIPRRTQLKYVFGEPVEPGASPDDVERPEVLRRVRREVAGALHELIERELARRAGIAI